MDAADWDRRYTEKEWLWSAEPNIFLVDEVGTLEPGQALDLACGEGRNSVWLAERGWRVTGVDFSSVALRRAAELAAFRGVEINLIQHDVRTYEPSHGVFDLVVVLYLHLPLPELETVWRRASLAVAPGGALLIVGHDTENLMGGYGGPQSADVLYTAEDVTHELEGFEIQRAERVLRAVETEEGIKTAVDCLVRAYRPAT